MCADVRYTRKYTHEQSNILAYQQHIKLLIFKAYFFEHSRVQNARKTPICVNVTTIKLKWASCPVLDQQFSDVLPQFIQFSTFQIEVAAYKLRTA